MIVSSRLYEIIVTIVYHTSRHRRSGGKSVLAETGFFLENPVSG